MSFSLLPPLLSKTFLLVVLPLTFVAYWSVWIIYARTLHPLSKIPGPFLASISRTWYMLQIYHGDMEYTQRRLHKKYGPLIRIAPNEIACAAPDAIKTIYPTQKPLNKTDFYPVWGPPAFSKHPDNFTATDEKVHADRRRIVNHVYSLSNVLRSEEYIDSCSRLFLKRLGEFADAGKSVDLGEWLQMYAFDVIGELFFGRMFGFMENSHDHGAWIHSLDTLMPALCICAVAPSYIRPLILGSAVLIPGAFNALKAVDNIAKAAKTYVGKRYDGETSMAEKGETPRSDLLQQLIDIHHEKGDKVDFKRGEVELEAYVALFAGSDTTAVAMRSVLYHLMKNPSTYQQLMSELDEAVKNAQLSSPVTYAEAIKLPYLSACIKEGMRLHPSVGLTMGRIVPSGGLELAGQYIPAGYRIGMNAAVVHYDTSIFGSDAAEFNPSRWLKGDNAATMDKYMLHFGAGTRTCIGKNISISELHKLIPYVLMNFTLELASEKPWTSQNLWFNKQSGIIVNLKRRT